MGTPTPGQAAREARQHAILDGADEKTAMDHAARAAIDWQRAEDASPTAGDYDHAAEILGLRDMVTELLSLFDFNSKGWNVARITDEHIARLRARLEPS